MTGSPASSVRETFGAPTETYKLANGTSRWIYSHQPLGYEVYAGDFDANGKPVSFGQMLTEKEIYEAKPGVWTKRDVAERFGHVARACSLLRAHEARGLVVPALCEWLSAGSLQCLL